MGYAHPGMLLDKFRHAVSSALPSNNKSCDIIFLKFFRQHEPDNAISLLDLWPFTSFFSLSYDSSSFFSDYLFFCHSYSFLCDNLQCFSVFYTLFFCLFYTVTTLTSLSCLSTTYLWFFSWIICCSYFFCNLLSNCLQILARNSLSDKYMCHGWTTSFSRTTLYLPVYYYNTCCIRSEFIIISVVSLFVEAFTSTLTSKLFKGLRYTQKLCKKMLEDSASN